MAGRAFYTGRENIGQAFEFLGNKNPCFSVWYGRGILISYGGDDIDEAKDLLDAFLENGERIKNTDLLNLKFHPKPTDGYIHNRSKELSATPIRIYSFDEADDIGLDFSRPNEGMRLSPGVYNVLTDIKTGIAGITAYSTSLEERVKALEAAPVEPAELTIWERLANSLIEKPETIGQILSLLPFNRVTASPQIGNIPADIAEKSDVTGKVLPLANIAQNGDNGSEISPASIAESSDTGGDLTNEENAIVDAALYRLGAHCDIVQALPVLVDYADANPAVFKAFLESIKK